MRRGTSKANIEGILFHPYLNLIACTSDKSSIHLFEIKKSIDKCIESKEYGFTNGNKLNNVTQENRKSNLKFLSVITKYFNSDWSVSKIKIDEPLKRVAFDAKNHMLTILTHDRIVYYVDIPKQT